MLGQRHPTPRGQSANQSRIVVEPLAYHQVGLLLIQSDRVRLYQCGMIVCKRGAGDNRFQRWEW